MKLRLIPIGETENSTVSRLVDITGNNKFLGFVIEDGYRKDKIQHETRIPAGEYQIVKRTVGGHFDKHKQKFNHLFVPQLINVPGFSDILIHVGNTVKDTSGCLLMNWGISFDNITGNWTGTQSVDCFKAFYNHLFSAYQSGEQVWINIQRFTLQR